MKKQSGIGFMEVLLIVMMFALLVTILWPRNRKPAQEPTTATYVGGQHDGHKMIVQEVCLKGVIYYRPYNELVLAVSQEGKPLPCEVK
jgi:hypothetical protein